MNGLEEVTKGMQMTQSGGGSGDGGILKEKFLDKLENWAEVNKGELKRGNTKFSIWMEKNKRHKYSWEDLTWQ